MPSMLDALKQAGLGNDQQLALASAEAELREEQHTPHKTTKALTDLETAQSTGGFLQAARQLLLSDPGKIKDIKQIAHQRKADFPAAEHKHFIARIMALEAGLHRCDKAEVKDFVNACLRRSNPVFDYQEFCQKQQNIRRSQQPPRR